MHHEPLGTPPREDMWAQLERSLIEQFLWSKGCDPAKLHTLPVERSRQLLRDASVYASGRLMEVEARAHLLEEMHANTGQR